MRTIKINQLLSDTNNFLQLRIQDKHDIAMQLNLWDKVVDYADNPNDIKIEEVEEVIYDWLFHNDNYTEMLLTMQMCVRTI